jgi:Domain of unknown function (DUF4268)
MFTREEASRTKQEFWTAFGKYMNPVPSAEGLKIHWVNYRTTISDVYFRLDAAHGSATIAISLEHSDLRKQQLYFEKLQQQKTLLQEALGEPWDWQLHATVEGKVISRIYKTLPAVSVLNKEDWPELISFFKTRMIALDGFWQDAKYSFEGLDR